jgi:hypothetical protein
MKNLFGFDIDDALLLAGLTRRSQFGALILPAVSLLTLGAAIGAGVGLMLAPSSGRRLRKDVGERIDQMRERIMKDAQKKPGSANATMAG